jgi:hypothetical protein
LCTGCIFSCLNFYLNDGVFFVINAFTLAAELEILAAELSRMKEDLARAMKRARNSTEKAAEVDKLRSRLERCCSLDELTVAREEAARWLSEAIEARKIADNTEKRLLNMIPSDKYSAMLQQAETEAKRAQYAEERLFYMQKASLNDLSFAQNRPNQQKHILSPRQMSDQPVDRIVQDHLDNKKIESESTGSLQSDLMRAKQETEGLRAEVCYYSYGFFSQMNIVYDLPV